MLERMTEETIQSIVSQAIDDACDFIESEIAPGRIKAQEYYEGKCDVEAEPGRSTLVSTKCRDTVRAVKPSLLRVFLQTDKPVEFVPRGDEDTVAAEQATEYVNWLFQKSNGFTVLSGAFQDALVKKVGVAKATYREVETVEIIPFQGVPVDQFAAVAAEDGVEVLEYGEDAGLAFGQLTRPGVKNEIIVESIPPEEFICDADAISIEDNYICGQRTNGRYADLFEMGFTEEDVEGLDEDENDEEQFARDGYSSDDENIMDPAMKRVTITEAYMRVDIEGTGVPKLYAFICGGTANKVLRFDEVEDNPFAIFEGDPEPHTFFGNSLVDLVMQDQDAATVFLRGMADNVTATNNPGLAFDTNIVNPIDVTNDEFGRKWRVNGAPHGAIMEMVTPFVAGAILPFLEYYDRTVEERTGVSTPSMGLRPDALRGATATAVDAAVAGSEGQTEVIARNLAEGGMKRLFKLLLKLVKDFGDPQDMMRISGAAQGIDPSSWDDDLDMAVNVGLGTKQEAEKKMALQMVIQDQNQIMQAYGLENGLVSLTNVRNARQDLLESAGIRNSDRYYLPMDPQREAQLKQQAAQAAQQQQPPQPDPTYIAGEQIKAQTTMQKAQMDNQTKMQTAAINAQVDMRTAAMNDDRERDNDETNAVLKAADLLGKYGIQVNQQQIDAMRERPRDQFGGQQ